MDYKVWPVFLTKRAIEKGRQERVKAVAWNQDDLVILPPLPSLPKHTCARCTWADYGHAKPQVTLAMEIHNISNQLSTEIIV